APLDVLRSCFFEPERLRPERTTAQVTEEAAREFGRVARSLMARGAEPHAAARVLIRVLFCLFAEDVALLPRGVFERLLENTRTRPAEFSRRLATLFEAMATGGSFGADDIRHFNGGLFSDDGGAGVTVDFAAEDVAALAKAATLDWSSIEPSIFG